MKIALVAVACLATAATAQTNTASPATGKKGAMTINQASGGGVRHGPRTGRPPTRVPAHPSQGKKNVRPANTHATTSKGKSGLAKGPTAKQSADGSAVPH